jgi:hypothetical protein
MLYQLHWSRSDVDRVTSTYFAVEVNVTFKEFHSLPRTPRKIKKSLSQNNTYPRRMTEVLISIL